MSERLKLPQSSYDRLRAACEDLLLAHHVDPDAFREYDPIPDAQYWEPFAPTTSVMDDVSVPGSDD